MKTKWCGGTCRFSRDSSPLCDTRPEFRALCSYLGHLGHQTMSEGLRAFTAVAGHFQGLSLEEEEYCYEPGSLSILSLTSTFIEDFYYSHSL